MLICIPAHFQVSFFFWWLGPHADSLRSIQNMSLCTCVVRLEILGQVHGPWRTAARIPIVRNGCWPGLQMLLERKCLQENSSQLSGSLPGVRDDSRRCLTPSPDSYGNDRLNPHFLSWRPSVKEVSVIGCCAQNSNSLRGHEDTHRGFST